MKAVVFLMIGFAFCYRVAAQAQELEQLRLDLEKLAQFKLMLSEMKSGYQTLANGYNVLKQIDQSNFNQHQQYFALLLQVSPEVKNNPTVQRINNNRQQFLTNYQTLLTRLKTSSVFTASELNDASQSIGAMGETINSDAGLLASVLTPGKLRMTDAERSVVIQKVDESIQKQVSKFRSLTDEYNKVIVLRLQQKRDNDAMKRLGNLR